METMTSRQRVFTAFKHQEPDRVPLFEFAVNPHIVDALVPARLGDLDQPFIGLRRNVEACVALGLDLLAVTVEELPETDIPLDGGRWIDEFGRVWQKNHTPGAGMGSYCGGMIRSLDDLKKYTPRPKAERRLPDEIRTIINAYRNHAFAYRWYGPLELTYESMGIENFCMSIYFDRSLVRRLLEIRTEWVLEIASRAINLGVDFIFLGDDAGFKTGPFISPRDYADLVAPCYQRISESLKVPVCIHSCGHVEDLIPIMENAGIQGIHPLEPAAQMDLKKVKSRFGRNLALFGNVDCGWVLCQPDRQLIRDEVDRCFRDGALGGGYFLSSSNSLHAGVPPENAIELFTYAKRVGSYTQLRRRFWNAASPGKEA